MTVHYSILVLFFISLNLSAQTTRKKIILFVNSEWAQTISNSGQGSYKERKQILFSVGNTKPQNIGNKGSEIGKFLQRDSSANVEFQNFLYLHKKKNKEIGYAFASVGVLLAGGVFGLTGTKSNASGNTIEGISPRVFVGGGIAATGLVSLLVFNIKIDRTKQSIEESLRRSVTIYNNNIN